MTFSYPSLSDYYFSPQILSKLQKRVESHNADSRDAEKHNALAYVFALVLQF